MKTFFKYIVLAAAITAFAGMARATPTLMLWTADTGFLTINDNGVGDTANTVNGAISFTGSLGHFTFNVVAAVSYPVTGTLESPVLDISFLTVSDATGGMLKILFSDNGFGPTAGVNATADLSGTTPGSVSYKAFGGATNTQFDASHLLCAGPFTGSFAADIVGAAINNGGPYSLTSVITITQSGAGKVSSGDIMLSVPDGGTTALLVGLGLLVMSAFARRRKVTKA